MSINHQQEAKKILTGTNDSPEAELLETLLKIATDEYNNEGESYLADSEYDLLERMLRAKKPDSKFLTTIGSDVRGGKIPLPSPMGGLDQLDEGDVEGWIKNNDLSDTNFVITDKLDGTSGLLVYDRGKLSIAYSRGNGTMGADITRHIKKMKNLPKSFNHSNRLEVRIEVILPNAAYTQIQQNAIKAGEIWPYKNARNYTAGKMNASESSQEFYDAVSIYATSIVSPEMGKSDQIALLEKLGFTLPHHGTVKGKNLTDAYLSKLLDTQRKASGHALDGIVIDVDDLKDRKSLTRGGSSLNPTYAKKYKVGTEENNVITKVVAVHWRPSASGYMKPRVQIEPVDLMGVTITYATGINAKFIRDNGIGPGALIEVTRAGDVIPEILSVKKKVEPALPDEEEFGDMVWSENEVDLIILDQDDNEQIAFYRTLNFFKHLDVAGLKEGNLLKLNEAGYNDPISIIKATEAQLKSAIGLAAGEKIHCDLKAKLANVELAKLAGASQTVGRGIGSRKLRKLIEVYGSLDNLTEEKIIAVDGFESRTAKKILDNLPKFSKFLSDISGYYAFSKPKEKSMSTSKQLNITVCFTGVRSKELEEAIEDKGGTVASGVNKNLTHLICKDVNGGSSKLVKAKSMGITLIDLESAKKLWM